MVKLANLNGGTYFKNKKNTFAGFKPHGHVVKRCKCVKPIQTYSGLSGWHVWMYLWCLSRCYYVHIFLYTNAKIQTQRHQGSYHFLICTFDAKLLPECHEYVPLLTIWQFFRNHFPQKQHAVFFLGMVASRLFRLWHSCKHLMLEGMSQYKQFGRNHNSTLNQCQNINSLDVTRQISDVQTGLVHPSSYQTFKLALTSQICLNEFSSRV